MKNKNFLITILFFAFTTNSVWGQQEKTSDNIDSLIRIYQNLKSSGTDENKAKIHKELLQIANRNENGIILATRIAASINESDLADSLKKLTVKRYPDGQTAMAQEYKDLADSKVNASEKEQQYTRFIKHFPEPKENPAYFYDYARANVATAYATENNINQNMKWISKIKDQSFKTLVVNANSSFFISKGDTSNAEALILSCLETSRELLGNKSSETKKEYFFYLRSLAKIQYKRGMPNEALKNITEVYEGTADKTPPLSELYGIILAANGRGKESLKILSEIYLSGKGTTEGKKAIRTAYIQDKGNDTGLDDYLRDLESKMKDYVLNLVKKNIIDLPSPEFSLIDLEGKKISMRDMRGKIVIIDFWATWCGPCLRSFPAMQKAVNKFKNDPEVKFLFIDTWEKNADPSDEIKDILKKGGYSFHVILDNKNTNVVGLFNIKGIPAKFIIDGSGKIRFKLTGFNGSDEAAVEEISAMIEIAKQKK